MKRPTVTVCACFQPPIIGRVAQEFLYRTRESVGMAGIFPGADRSKYLIFLRTTFHVFLVDHQEVSGPVTDRDCLYMLILLNGRGIFNGKVSTERDRVIIGISDIAQVFSLAGGTTPLAGIDVIEVTSATDIPYTLVMPRTFRQGSAGETDIRDSQLFRPTEHSGRNVWRNSNRDRY